ncbi:MAG: primosomal protein N' [Candidatus Coatesbacteria bacterium]|nr:MAG: primosomal protein N' [Candidatus Coatesbacteria bacterium]
MTAELYVDVHFPRPPFGPFTYRLAAGPPPAPGCRLLVELGRRRAVSLAGRPASPPPSGVTAKDVQQTLDVEPLLPLPSWELLEYVARRYASSVGEATRWALPIPLDARRDDLLFLTEEFARGPALEGWEAEEAAAAAAVREAGWLGTRAAGPPEIIRGLVERGVLALEPYAARPPLDDVFAYASPEGEGPRGTRGRQLWEELAAGPQPLRRYYGEAKSRAALRRLLRSRHAALGLRTAPAPPPPEEPAPTLFAGGSRRSRVEEALGAVREGGAETVLLLAPEIHLVPAFQTWAADFWGEPFQSYSSEASPAARWEVFRRCRRGTVRRVVGTRSALFLPLPPATAVVVAEEAASAYKQWEGSPYYHARDVAFARASGAPLAMTAAAPSLEAYGAVASGEVALRHLPRAGGARPELTVVDMAGVVAAEGPVIFSAALIEELRAARRRRERALVIVNRRGYVPYIYCEVCGRALQCPACEVAFTYHRDEQTLRCHYCLRREPLPRRCPTCGKERLTGVGFGTEKLAAEVRLLFEEARIGRADSDALRTPLQVKTFWADFAAGKFDVVVGTQMALRALDDEKVTFVAVANADTALNIPDFRAAEYTFRMLTQLREPTPARRRLLLQTFHPDHYAVAAAVADDFEAFARRELEFRRRLRLPPYTRLINVVVAERKAAAARAAAEEVAARLADILGPEAEVGVPTPAPVARRRGYRRWQVLARVPPATIERAQAGEALAALVRRRGPLDVTVDVDPYDLF